MHFVNIAAGYTKATVAGLATVGGVVATGGAVVYGGVTGDFRAADDLAETTRRAARDAAWGMEEAGRGIHDGARMVVNKAGPASLLYDVPSLSGFAWPCAKVSQLCYDDYSSRQSSFKDKEGDEWNEVDPNGPVRYNTEHFAVYRNGTGNVIIGCRGSAECRDWVVTNVLLFFTAVPCDRIKEVYQLVEAMQAKYRNVYMAGHSLGGNIAMVTSLRYRLKCHCFNPGAGLQDSVLKYYTEKSTDQRQIKAHCIHSDLASTLIGSSRAVEVLFYAQKYGTRDNVRHVHSMDNFVY